MQGRAGLVETLVSHLLISGDAFLEAVALDGLPRELHALRPDRMRVIAGSDGWPEAYEYRVGAEATRFDQRAEPFPPVLHIKLFNPLDDHFGLSPLEPAAAAVDLHNAASAWNKALLDNAARPSGALIYKGPDGQGLSDDQVERLKEELEAQFSGARNAGRPLLLDGGLDWRPMSLTPQGHGLSVRPRTPPPAKSRSPSACRPCCSAFRATRPTRTTRRPMSRCGARP